MTELKDYQSILDKTAERVKSFFAKYPDVSDEFSKRFAEINETKIRKVEPEIMVYGIYNAGKSSILNELIGEDKATVEDIPTTDKVTYYAWQGYKIADTPGIFAPIEHELVTQDHLRKADIVLFVMSADGSNEKAENYRRMKEIIDAGKKIIIVLNDKNGDLGKNDAAIQEIKRKVAVNMNTVGIENVDEKYCIVTVNAARARKGRVENKPRFVEKSGLDELKSVILSELKRTTSFDVLRRGIRELENILNDFITKLESREKSELLIKMNDVIRNFNQQKRQMRQEINSFINRKADNLGAALPQMIWENHNNYQEVMNAEIAKINAAVQREIQRQLEDAATILELELQTFAEVKISSSSVESESFKNILTRLTEINRQPNQVVAMQNDIPAKNDPATVGIIADLLTESGTVIAKQLAKTGIGKTIASTALGKVLGSVVPVIGPIITVASLLSMLLGSNDRADVEAKLAARNEAERRRVEAEMQARQELNQKCRYFADNLADELKTVADKSISEILDKYEAPFKAEIEMRKNENDQLGSDILVLRELVNKYDLLCVELGAK